MPEIRRSNITIERKPGRPWFRFQNFVIEVDRSIAGTIRGGQSLVLPVESGQHQIRIKFRMIVWSDPLFLSVEEGQEMFIACDTDWRGYPRLWIP